MTNKRNTCQCDGPISAPDRAGLSLCPRRHRIHEKAEPGAGRSRRRLGGQARILSGPFRLKSNRDRLLISDELPFRQAAFIAASSIIVGALTGVIAASGNSFSFGYDVINYRGAEVRRCNAFIRIYNDQRILFRVYTIRRSVCIDRSTCVRVRRPVRVRLLSFRPGSSCLIIIFSSSRNKLPGEKSRRGEEKRDRGHGRNERAGKRNESALSAFRN